MVDWIILIIIWGIIITGIGSFIASGGAFVLWIWYPGLWLWGLKFLAIAAYCAGVIILISLALAIKEL